MKILIFLLVNLGKSTFDKCGHFSRDGYITLGKRYAYAALKHMGIKAKEAIKGPGSVDYGMKWLQKRKLVIDRRRTPHVWDEFSSYEYEKDRHDDWISGGRRQPPDRCNALCFGARVQQVRQQGIKTKPPVSRRL